jgi:hypothetical protein
VQDGLLAVEFHKPPGKSGPGSGRPAKMYRPVAVRSVPPCRTGTTTSPAN